MQNQPITPEMHNLYGVLLINRIAGYKSSTFVLGIVICWIISYIIVYARRKMAK